MHIEDDDRPYPRCTSEREMEDMWCRMLASQGIAYQRQVSTVCGRADIVTASTVYEVKLELTRGVLFKAIGQVTMYAAALKLPRRVVIGRAIDADWFETMRSVARSQGVLINWMGERATGDPLECLDCRVRMLG